MFITRPIYSLLIGALAVASVTQAQEAWSPLQATEPDSYQPAVIDTVTAKPVNAGINPAYAALEIQGRVLLGSNPCRAQGVKVKLAQSREDDKIIVTALRDDSAARHRICTMEYNPQYAQLRTSVLYDKNIINDIRIRNVDVIGEDQSAFDLNI